MYLIESDITRNHVKTKISNVENATEKLSKYLYTIMDISCFYWSINKRLDQSSGYDQYVQHQSFWNIQN